MSAVLPSIKVKKFVIQSTSESKVQVVELERAQVDGQTEVVQKTVLSSDYSSQLAEIAILQQLSRFPAIFPRLYAYTENRGAGVTELMIEHFPAGNLHSLVTGSRKKFSKEKLHRLVMDLTQALTELHSLRIAHRNISLSAIQCTAGGFKLAGDYSRAVQFSGENRGVERGQEEKTYAQDVLELGLCFVQVVLVDPRITTFNLYATEVNSRLRNDLAYYDPVFGTIVYGMTDQSIRNRFRAAQAYETLNSQVLDTFSDNAISSDIPSINVPKIMEMVNRPLPPSQSSIHNSSQPVQKKPSTAQWDFDRLWARISTGLELKYLEDDLLKKMITDLFAFYGENRGQIQIDLKSDLFVCSVCLRDRLIYERSVLPICAHLLCRTCLNSRISEMMHQGRFTCPIDLEGFDPFDDQVMHSIEPFVMKRLDAMRLNEKTTCPKCGTHYLWEEDEEEDPVTIECLGCAYQFCSSCKKKAHKHCCDDWVKRLRKAREASTRK
jgi:serine/threonine protein kinase